MATIKSEYYRFNGVSWDIHYFKTTMDMVDGLALALAGKAPTNNAQFTGYVRTPRLVLDNPIQNFNAFTSYKIHDSIQTNLLAGKWKKLKVTWDGVESPTMAQQLTDLNYEQSTGLAVGKDGDANHILNIDLVSNGLYSPSTGVVYSNGTIILSFYTATNFPTAWSARCRNRDGIWTSMTLAQNGAQLKGEVPISNYLTDIEFTFSTGTGAPYITGTTKWALVEVEYYGNRMQLGQGALITSVGGYIGGDLDVAGLLKANGQQVYHPGNKPAWADIVSKPSWIGASKPTYTAAEVGALPITGGVITGDIYLDGGVLTSNGGGITYSGDWFDFGGAQLKNLDSPSGPADAATKEYVDTKAGPPGIVSIASTGTVNLTSTHMNKFVVAYPTGGALTLSLAKVESDNYPTGTEIRIARYGSSDVVISSTGLTLVSDNNMNKIAVNYGVVTLKKMNTTTWILFGALKT